MFRSDEKRPDGVRLVPWALGRCLAWDATVVDTLAVSHLPGTSVIAGSADEAASAAKTRKYEGLTSTHIFVHLAFETLEPVCSEGASLIASIGSRETPEEPNFFFRGSPLRFREVTPSLFVSLSAAFQLCCSSCRPD